MEQISEEESELLISKSFSNNYKERIIDLLKENSFGLTIADISKELGTTRHTVAIILAELRGAEVIEIRNVGVAKVHMLRGGARDEI